MLFLCQEWFVSFVTSRLVAVDAVVITKDYDFMWSTVCGKTRILKECSSHRNVAEANEEIYLGCSKSSTSCLFLRKLQQT